MWFPDIIRLGFCCNHSFHFIQMSDSVLLLRDGNSTLCPLAKDSVDSIRDAQWLDLPPLKCVAAAPHALPVSTPTNLKTQAAIIILAVQQQILMPSILRCDIETVKHILLSLDHDSSEFKSSYIVYLRSLGVFCEFKAPPVCSLRA